MQRNRKQALFSSAVPGPEAMGTNRNTAASFQISGNNLIFILWQWLSTEKGFPGGLWSFHPFWWIFKSYLIHDPGLLALGGPAWVGGLDKMSSRGSFQPQPFCDGAILWLMLTDVVKSMWFFLHDSGAKAESEARIQSSGAFRAQQMAALACKPAGSHLNLLTCSAEVE